MINIKNLHKSFGDLEVIKGIDLEIKKGEIVTIVGPSGSGKSTVLRCMNLLEVPTKGQIIFEGTDITDKKVNIDEIRQRIGMVFQNFNLFPNMTVLDNITLAPMRLKKLSREDANKKAEILLERVGLLDKKDSYPSQLSGGQKQRVAIARALANDPEILISDESTSALDPKTTKQILALLQELNQKLGLTVVMITHEMQIVKDICHRVAVMQNGRLIEEGSVLDIFSNPKEPLTQEFIKTATGIEDALVKIEKQAIVQNLPKDDLLVQLKYAGTSTDEPILNQIYKQFEVTANILYGNIEILDDTPVGEMIVVLSGEDFALAGAQEAIVAAGIELTVLKRGA